MAKNPGVIKIVMRLHAQGLSILAIARNLNLSIAEVSDIVNVYK